MNELSIGYIGLSKASWQTPKIEALMQTAVEGLKQLPIRVIHDDGLTVSEPELLELCRRFKSECIDAVIVHLPSFPIGAAIPLIAQQLSVPIILFANPEEPEEGGVWAQNSFCGANMAAHVLHKLKVNYQFLWGAASDIATLAKPYLNVLNCCRELAAARIGLIGGRVPGFYTSNFDELKLRRTFGTAVEVMDLVELLDTAGNCTEEAATTVKDTACSVRDVTDNEMGIADKLYQAFLRIQQKYSLSSFAVRCWPEFSDIYGIAPCAVIGMLNDAGLVTSCEGDTLGAVTMIIQKSLANEALPFFVDLISFDYQENSGVVWHCGAAPVSLCRRFEETVLRKHGRVDGGDKKGITNDFAVKPGRITLAKLDETETGYRMLIAAGTALDTESFIRGNPLQIKFDGDMQEMINTIMKQGFDHHYCVVHADIKEELLAFCELMDIEPVVVD